MLSVQDVQCIRDDRILFENLSFTVSAGQILQIEGKNGSGKTSLLRILCGLTLPTEGAIYWKNKDIQAIKTEYWAELTYIGHLPAVKADLTPLENLAMSRALTAESTGLSFQEALKIVGLYGFEDVLSRTLSAGQHRRVALARLLINKTKLWILDEPFTALDKTAVAMVEHWIDQHAAQGGITILTSHSEVNCGQGRMLKIHL